MDRREFIRAALLAPCASIAWCPSPARAEAFTMATVAATAQVASAVIGYIGRGSDPTVPLLVSLTGMIEAIGMRIDVIDQKLDLLIKELAEIRVMLKVVPKETVTLEMLTHLREPWNAYLEDAARRVGFANSSQYFSRVTSAFERLQSARRRYIDVTTGNFDGAVHVALAQDSEVTIAAELLRSEAIDAGYGLDPVVVGNLLAAYQFYFERALNPDLPGSLAYLAAGAREQVVRVLSAPVQIKGVRRYSARPDSIEPEVVRSVREILAAGSRTALCGWKGDLCLVRGSRGGCAEPGHRDFYDVKFAYARKTIVDPSAQIDDKLQYPYLHEVGSDFKCPNGTDARGFVQPVFDQEASRIGELNLWVTNYYRLAYVTAICQKALEINTAQRVGFDELV